MTTFSMKEVYQKLGQIGLKKKKVNECMPDWWLENYAEITKTKAGMQETLWRIANNFSIDFASLVDSFSDKEKKPAFIFGNHLFKHSKNLNETELQPAVSIAMFIAKNTIRVYEKPLADLDGLTALSIREQLLQSAKWIDFETLLSYCWSLGIPVIFSGNIPKKMDGLALKIQDRPAIILTKGRTHGYLVFDLAHELGHIVLGHLNQKKMIVDEKINANNKETEIFEQQADEFALELLTGVGNTRFATKKHYSPIGLSQAVLKKANEYHIDPLHIVLNYGHSSGQFPLANQVLSYLVMQLGLEKTDQQIAYDYYIKNIDLDDFDDEEIIMNIIKV